MKIKLLLFAFSLAFYASTASAIITGSESRASADEMSLAPITSWSQLQAQSFFFELDPAVVGLETLTRFSRSTRIVGLNQVYTHVAAAYSSVNGALLGKLPALSLRAPATDAIDFTVGIVQQGAKQYAIESVYSHDINDQGTMKVQVSQTAGPGAPTGPVKRYARVFPKSNIYGSLNLSDCFVRDINGDGVEEIVIKYSKKVGLQRIRTFLVYNFATGAKIRQFQVRTR